MKIIIGTQNQKKIDVVRAVFGDVLGLSDIEIIAHAADSHVPEAPHDKQTYDGAINRAHACMSLQSADYYVGIESGLVERYGHFFEEAWAVIITSNGIEHIGYSSGLLLPPIVVQRMHNGETHDNIMSDFDKKFNLPDDNRDTWSRYTGGHISRQLSLEESLRNAIVQTVPTDRNLYNYS